MKNIKKADRYAIIAGICFGIVSLIELILDGVTFYMICFILVATTLFYRKEKFVVVLSALGAIYGLYNIMIYGKFDNFLFLGVIFHISIVFLFFLTIKKNAIVKKIWFIPAIVLAINYFFAYLIRGFQFQDLFWIIVAILLGLWLKEHDFISGKNELVNNYSKFDSRTRHLATSNQAIIGEADMLKTYKELLEVGIITPEEFEKKKKQIFK